MWCAGGISEYAARLPSTLLVLALGLVARATVITWAGRGAALGTAMVALTCTAMVDKGRIAEIEAMYTALTGIAMLIWQQGWMAGAVSARRWMLVGLVLGLGLLAKGPPHLLFFYGWVLLLSVAERRARELLLPAHWGGLAWMMAPFAFWLWQARAGLFEAKGTWSAEMTGRFVEGGRSVEWSKCLTNPLSSALNLAPWVFAIFTRPWCQDTQAHPKVTRQFLQMALLYGLFTLIVLPAVPGYRPRYSMPAYGVLMAALAIWSDRIPAQSPMGRLWGMGTLVAALAAIPAAAFSIWINRGSWPMVLAAVVSVCLASFVWQRRQDLAHTFTRWRVTALAILALGLSGWGVAAPLLSRKTPFRNAAATLSAQLAPGERFIALRPGHIPYLIYLHGRYEILLAANQLPSTPVKVLVPKHRAEALEALKRPSRILAEVGRGEANALLVQLE
jgi:4-amino-4-deoxy-L-arabinose transferase-like glycosyltransferase